MFLSAFALWSWRENLTNVRFLPITAQISCFMLVTTHLSAQSAEERQELALYKVAKGSLGSLRRV